MGPGRQRRDSLQVLDVGTIQLRAFHPGNESFLPTEVTVEISAAMMPGVLSLPHGWGHDLPGAQLAVAGQRPGANLNLLMDIQARDPLSGNAVLSGVAVTLAAV